MSSFRPTKTRETNGEKWRSVTGGQQRMLDPLTEAAGSVVSLAAGVWSPSIADPPELLMNEPPLWSVMRMIEAGPAGCLIDARSYPDSPAESSFKHVRVSWAVGQFAPCLHLYDNPLVLIRAGSPFVTDRNYRADVKRPNTYIQEANSCWFPHLPYL